MILYFADSLVLNFKATCVNDPIAYPAVQPSKPTLNVLSESIFIDPLLIKPTRTIKQASSLGFAQQDAVYGQGGCENPENQTPCVLFR
jgi:hypothetical protein